MVRLLYGMGRLAHLLHSLLIISTLLNFAFSASGYPVFDPPATPRAALVALVENGDMEAMVSTINQMETHFNGPYGYDWTLFSHEELSLEFKQAASNATHAAVTFDIIPEEHCGVNGGAYHHKARWNAGLFAREPRLRFYDWYWKVEPGTQITHDFNFDVFRTMHDERYYFGLNSFPKISPEASQMLLETVTQFMDEHREIVWPIADIAWLNTSNTQRHVNAKPAPRKQQQLQQDSYKEGAHLAVGDHNQTGLGFAAADDIADNGSQELGSKTGSSAVTYSSIFSRCPEAGSTQCPRETPFELGSLHTFRSPEYIKFFNHLDSLGEFYYNHIGDVPIRSIGATLFVLERWVWLLPDTECKVGEYCPPELNLGEVSFLASINGGDIFGWDEDYVRFVKNNLLLWVQPWNAILEDFRRQDEVPAPPLGHTTLDDRNQEPIWDWHIKIYLFKEWVRTWTLINVDLELEPFDIPGNEAPQTTDVPAEKKSLLSFLEEKLIKPHVDNYRIYGDEFGNI
ncbi:nucleotide-diphospho-sugar transferase [Sodiomyces alkalinus F11]|uniref:Nucleotide-diphospho-sugar transferase n=1 Tax=Sodiomyces alkalinus (strain CBS 110278 / VKM F-3762 / F11) TaxID=1314773 RepID=A0A3N2PPN6_SODAK|nr:nucleotide-diphospho-sugar transferase [Sodiomyces alkalinus F11]ROT36465.1 nucleotide-diphospho-sugar transferase [Sodiomyces alkalinus F11]